MLVYIIIEKKLIQIPSFALRTNFLDMHSMEKKSLSFLDYVDSELGIETKKRK